MVNSSSSDRVLIQYYTSCCNKSIRQVDKAQASADYFDFRDFHSAWSLAIRGQEGDWSAKKAVSNAIDMLSGGRVTDEITGKLYRAAEILATVETP